MQCLIVAQCVLLASTKTLKDEKHDWEGIQDNHF